ncbi:MAG TPA: right-handed parallel beta-helix repeat-containing protein [Chthoniobacterales bacterium]|nr:right-handed parallel beta-helix repeat-containing protein [Chthoniobacterales bacterium]
MKASAVHEVILVPQQFATIQAAIDAVVGPATIVVGPGVYPESISVLDKETLIIQSARLSRRGVTIRGFEGSAVIHAVRSQLHLSGICIRSDFRLRGLLVDDGQINLQECIVAGNRSAGFPNAGAGMLCRRSKVHLQKSAIIGNAVGSTPGATSAGGGLYLEDCVAEIAGTTIQANVVYGSSQARGGGVAFVGSKVRLWRGRVTDNALYADDCAGGGIYLENSRGCQVGGSVVTGNDCQLGRGGGIFVAGSESDISVHRNSFVRQNHPTDIEFEPENVVPNTRSA